MTTYDALRKARAYLLEHGWAQDAKGYGREGRPQCTMGALKVTMGCEWHDPSSERAVGALVTAIGLGYLDPIPEWNDAPDRTFDDVIAAFDKAIAATAPPREDTPIFTALEDLPAEAYLDCLSTLALIPAEALA